MTKKQRATAEAKRDAYLAEDRRLEAAAIALLERTTDTAPIIDRILAASRKPCPEIVASRVWLATDGQYYNVFGFPLGVSAVEEAECKIVGYCYRDPNGTTYGTREASPEALRAKFDAYQDATAADFRIALEAEPERLASRVAYWLKGDL
jgi:hypothetical protein